ncbi:MAG: hypothetical protein MMC33_002241 [Icmadophila ericetorum]|nr:hypothetical protein [Icmadophila ericetorum]
MVVIIGAFTAVVIVLFLHLKPQPQNQRRAGFFRTIWQLDPIGSVLSVTGITCLLLALQWGGTTCPWHDVRIIVLLVMFAILLLIAIGVQIWLGDEATVPPRIFCQRTIALSFIFSIFLGGAFFLMIYMVPIWFQAVKDTDALRSGIDSIALICTSTFAIMLSRVLTSKFGPYMPCVYSSVAITSIGAGLITTFTPETSTSKWVGYQLLFGFGVGLAFQIPQVAAQTVLPLADIPQGSAMNFFAETFGGAIFVSVANNTLNNRLVKYIGALKIPSVDPQTVVHLGATQFRGYVPPEYLAQTVEAYNRALVKTFQIGLIVACLSALGAMEMEWRSVHQSVSGTNPMVKDLEMDKRSAEPEISDLAPGLTV